jgi:putative glycosyltransferase (TIGR04348 family)
MRILLVTPTASTRQSGNAITARRWSKLFRELGHTTRIAAEYTTQGCDVLVALHAWKSAASVRRFRELRPRSPLILALTGTDLYQDIPNHAVARQSLELASRLVLLQVHGLTELPNRLAHKARVIYQSAEAPQRKPAALKTCFEVSVVGHLRAVKDPFRTALAVRRLPADSRIRVFHYGRALQESMEQRAAAEMRRNPRYEWLGELPHGQVQRRIARSRLLVQTSQVEGGANSIGEALASGTPVLSSRISGSLGILGDSYPGYFSYKDTQGLADLLQRAEGDSTFYRQLEVWCQQRSSLIDPARERKAWEDLLGEFLWEACQGPS